MPYNHKITWTEAFRNYLDRRLFWIFCLGCASGFPWVLIGSNMSGWLKDAGLTLSAIGYFGSIFSVYAINFLWAPLVDRIKLPLLYNLLGQRRSWIILCQLIMLIGILFITNINPQANLVFTSLIALIIAIASATQDIAIDAFRIDTISLAEDHKLAHSSAMSVIGWTTGYSLPGYLAFINADDLGWSGVYKVMAYILLALMILTLLTKEPQTSREKLQTKAEERHKKIVGSKIAAWITVTVIEPFLDFFRRNGVQVAVTILLFVFLFKIGEAFLGRMSIAFYKDIGFTNAQIGYYSKFIGWIATIIFTFVSSAINIKFGIIRGLMIGGIAMSTGNLMFSWIAYVGPDETLFFATILVDNFTTAFSTVAFVSFLTVLTGQAFSATQYALLASLGSLGRTTIASFSGALVDYLQNWSLFFILTTVMVIPSLIMLYYLRNYLSSIIAAKKSDQENL